MMKFNGEGRISNVAESELKLTSLLLKADLELEGLVAKCPP